MAQLRQLMKTGAGALGSTSQEEIEKLSARKGRTAAPIQPLETGVIGGTPDQAKMAGTPNQRLSALRQSFGASSDVAGFKRREQAKQPIEGAAADAKQARLAEIEGLGELGSRVRDIALRRFEQEAQVEEVDFDVADLKLDEQQTELINRLKAGEQLSGEEYREVAKALLGEEITAQMAVDDLRAEIQSRLGLGAGTAATTRAAGELRMNELNLADIEALGFTDVVDLAGEFGLTDEQFNELTLNQMQDLLDSKQAEQFDRSRELRSVLTDPNATDAQRANARNQLELMGQTGEQDVEREFEDLERAVDEGRQVTFAGESLDVNRLLDDEYLSAKISLALEDEQVMADLVESEPEFAEFIESHRGALELMAEQIDAGTKGFIQIQEDNLALSKPSEHMVSGFSDGVMQLFYPDYGDIVSGVYEENGIIQLLKSGQLDSDSVKTLESVINEFAAAGDDDIVSELGKLSLGQLTTLGFNSGDAIEHWKETKEEYERIADVDANSDEFAMTYLGATATKLQELVSHAHALRQSGIKHPVVGESLILDRDRDGKLDNMVSIKQQLMRGNLSLKDLVKRGSSVNILSKPIIDANEITKMKPVKDAEIFESMKDVLSNDGMVSNHVEAQRVADQLTTEQLFKLTYDMNVPGMSSAAKSKLRQLTLIKANERATEHFNYWVNTNSPHRKRLQEAKINSWADLTDWVTRMREQAKATGGRVGNREYVDAAKWVAERISGLSSDHQVMTDAIKRQSKQMLRMIRDI